MQGVDLAESANRENLSVFENETYDNPVPSLHRKVFEGATSRTYDPSGL